MFSSQTANLREKEINSMTATTTAVRPIATSAEPGFGAALRAEWTKFRSVRSTWIIVALAIVLSVGFSAIASLVTGMTFDSWSESAQSIYDPVTNSMTGVLFRLILLVTFGVVAVTSEYRSGMIRTTFMVNPRRLQVLTAKMIIDATRPVQRPFEARVSVPKTAMEKTRLEDFIPRAVLDHVPKV
jgi:hypothetical protein